jgi:hypothetical protein
VVASERDKEIAHRLLDGVDVDRLVTPERSQMSGRSCAIVGRHFRRRDEAHWTSSGVASIGALLACGVAFSS